MQYCDTCDNPSMILHEVEKDGERFAICPACFDDAIGFDLLLGTRYAEGTPRPTPREFDWEA